MMALWFSLFSWPSGFHFVNVSYMCICSAHPGAPDKPPFETIVGLLTAPIDKLRDMFETFPSDEEIKAAKPNWNTSQGC